MKIKSKAIIVILLLLIVLSSISIQADDETIVQINPSIKTVSIGDTFILNVSCVPNQAIKSYELKILFNASLLQANSVIEGNIFDGYSTFFNDGIIDNVTGTIVDIYGLIVGAGNVSVDGSFVVVSFTAKSVGTSILELYDVGVTNETAYISINVLNGTITVQGNITVKSVVRMMY